MSSWHFPRSLSRTFDHDIAWACPHLVGVDDDLALLLVTARDQEHVVEGGRVVQHGLVLEGGEDVAGAVLKEVDAALIHRQPEGLGPVGREGLLRREVCHVRFFM